MKLYTEEQVNTMLSRARLHNQDDTEMFTNEYLIAYETPIELPSDDEMANASNHCKDGQVKVGFLRGVLWYQEQILNKTNNL